MKEFPGHGKMKLLACGTAAALLAAMIWAGGPAAARQLDESGFEAKPVAGNSVQAKTVQTVKTSVQAASASGVKAALNVKVSGRETTVDKGVTAVGPGKAGTLAVTNRNGSITFTQGTGKNIEVHMKVIVADSTEAEAKAAADKVKLQVRQGTTLGIEVEDGNVSRTNPPQVALSVTLPQKLGAKLEAELNNGDISLSNVKNTGTIKLKVNNGDIAARGVVADIVLQADNGSVAVADAKGAADAAVVNGEVEATRISGALALKATNGTLTATGVFAALKASVVAGEIDISTSKLGGNWDVSSATGDVTLALPAHSSVKVDGKVMLGEPETDLPLTVKGSRISGTIGAGTYTVSASSLSDLSILKN
ncbi:DUF4097 family beta strand repeat-containing protein [Paenibacillus sp. NFR01]|uniref:DUF4097 family beta strand repeat-containing protein n=1 Tax=Paenibacillus sp. NFR01 TaxID=1566279 RepID=UPI0008D6FD3B|nr:DUF4097 family beta strand repeat-containing protein [Paenibacillus sp. NFR01]SET97073.1 Putative adhesin [Paenibacillus sp. NFR01]